MNSRKQHNKQQINNATSLVPPPISTLPPSARTTAVRPHPLLRERPGNGSRCDREWRHLPVLLRHHSREHTSSNNPVTVPTNSESQQQMIEVIISGRQSADTSLLNYLTTTRGTEAIPL
ncbi:hypothetical protein MLD38_024693 [Melastoma candidum]|uniref:Uncharacterized protein n=1 Tax=Melastoma candidum TaxID=119954 RepID=A0ACB9NT33_9MYRT|nr:hypothetical protein MLD38_024693 [Melastoma candidum]